MLLLLSLSLAPTPSVASAARYDMSAVEEMEQITQLLEQQSKAQRGQPAPAQELQPTEAQLLEAEREEERAFFSEQDIDSFLEARSRAQVRASAAAQAKAQAEAEAQARAQAEAQARAQAKAQAEAAARARAQAEAAHKAAQQAALEARQRAHAAAQAKAAAERRAEEQLLRTALATAERQQALATFERVLEAQRRGQALDADDVALLQAQVAENEAARVEAEERREAEAREREKREAFAAAKAAADALRAAEAEQREREHDAHFVEVESRALRALHRAESLAKMRAAAANGEDDTVLLQTGGQAKLTAGSKTQAKSKAKGKAKAKSTEPWWASPQGVSSNFQRYKSGVRNARVTGEKHATNAANSYVLPLGRSVKPEAKAQAHGADEDLSLLQQSSSVSASTKTEAKAEAKASAQPYATVPAPSAGDSALFNPASDPTFHPPLPVSITPPQLPQYMAESAQPWAGAGFYGSGGGQGPHPGSEAFVPRPGVQGKEFGIRAREAWEAHRVRHSDPQAFHDAANQPPYPYYPAWSREAEVGGRPDLFPRAMPAHMLPQVHAAAQREAQAAAGYSERFYPHYNRPVPMRTQPLGAMQPHPSSMPPMQQPMQHPMLVQTGPGPVRMPSLRRAQVGYPPVNAGPAPSWSGADVPAQFPQPSDSNSFDEAVRYSAPSGRPTLVAPHRPTELRNVLAASSPIDKGLHPLFGGLPQFVPVPVAAQQQDLTATQ